jgi:hypothetical protein
VAPGDVHVPAAGRAGALADGGGPVSLPGGLNLVTVTGNFADVTGMAPSAVTVTFGPAASFWRGNPAVPVAVTDPGGQVVLTTGPVTVRAGSGGTFKVDLVATDNEGLAPDNWLYLVTLCSGSQPPQSFTCLLPHSPSTVDFSELVAAPAGVALYAYVPQAGGSMSGPLVLAGSPPLQVPGGGAGDVLVSDGSGNLTLDTLAAAGVATTSALTAETSRAETAEALALQKSANLGDVGSASTARTNLGLGSAATQSTSAFDAAGAASTAQTTAEAFATSAVATETTRAETAEVAISSLRKFPVALYSGADPSGATDSTAAVTAAKAAAVAAGGGIVSFGSGTWKFDTVTIPGVPHSYNYVGGNVHFRFAGVGATILTPLNANSPLFKVDTSVHPTAAGVRFTGGFTIMAHPSGSTGAAIDLNAARQFVIESPSYFDSSKGTSGSPGTYQNVIGLGVNTYGCRIVNPVCEGQTIGNAFIGADNPATVIANLNVIDNPLFEACTSPYMIDAAGTVSLTVNGGLIEGNTVTAFIRLGWKTTVRNCWFEQGAATGYTFAMDAAGVDNPTFNYDPGTCLLEWNNYNVNPDILTIPAGVHTGTTVLGPLGDLQIVDNTNTLIVLGSSVVTELANDAEGGTSGTGATTGNSGGVSGNAFNAVNGTVTFDNAQAAAPGSLSYKLVTSASTAYLQWNIPVSIVAGTTLYLRAYVQFSGSPFNTYILTDAGDWHNVTCTGTHWTARAVAGSTVTGTTTPVAGAWYRVEAQFTYSSTAGTTVARIYNASGTLLETITATGGTNPSTTTVAYGAVCAQTGTMWLDNLAVSDGGWIGPAVPTDQNASDIQPLGTQAAGSSGVLADAEHVHAMPRLDQVGTPSAAVGLGSQKIHVPGERVGGHRRGGVRADPRRSVDPGRLGLAGVEL